MTEHQLSASPLLQKPYALALLIVTGLFSLTLCSNGRQGTSIHQFAAISAELVATQHPFDQAKAFKALRHVDREQRGIVPGNLSKPVPVRFSEFVGIDHSLVPFRSNQTAPTITGTRLRQPNPPGVVRNLAHSEGTGGGPVAQHRTEIEFSA